LHCTAHIHPWYVQLSCGCATIFVGHTARLLLRRVCAPRAGQSNMALPLAATYNMETELREAGQYGATLRLMQIRPNRGSMTPQLTAGLDIAWSRPSSHSGEMSGLCYYYGA
jgi:hypothetical protein